MEFYWEIGWEREKGGLFCRIFGETVYCPPRQGPARSVGKRQEKREKDGEKVRRYTKGIISPLRRRRDGPGQHFTAKQKKEPLDSGGGRCYHKCGIRAAPQRGVCQNKNRGNLLPASGGCVRGHPASRHRLRVPERKRLRHLAALLSGGFITAQGNRFFSAC